MTDHNSLAPIATECPDISVVIPLLNEAESLPELYERIVAHTGTELRNYLRRRWQ